MRLNVLLILFILFFQAGCASSPPARELSSDIDHTVSALSSDNGLETETPLTVWDNASQTKKGILIGGVTGAVAGGVSSIGWLPGMAGGAILGGSIGSWIDSETTLLDQIKNRGVEVFVLGDQVRLIIPVSTLFINDSAILRYSGMRTLDLISIFLKQYLNRSILIAAYADSGVAHARILTRQQARQVMRYLWKTEINTRLLYAVGYGSQRPVMEGSVWHPNVNDRIEINLQKLPG